MNSSQQGPSHTEHSSSYNGPQKKIGCCATFSIFLGIALTAMGAGMTAFSSRKPSPPFDDPFFTNNNNGFSNLKIVGTVLLSTGLTFFIVSSIYCCVILVGGSKSMVKEGPVMQGNNQIHSENTIQMHPIYPQQYQITSAPISSYNYHLNAPTPYYPSPGNTTDQPPPYDYAIGFQPCNPNLIQVNNPYGNASSAYVLPIATIPPVADVHPYPIPETK